MSVGPGPEDFPELWHYDNPNPQSDPHAACRTENERLRGQSDLMEDALAEAYAEREWLRRALRAEHALLTRHLDAEGYSGTFPATCEVCALLEVPR